MSILFLHCSIKPPVFPRLGALLAELAEPTVLVLPVAMAQLQPEISQLFGRVIAIPDDFKENAMVEWEVFRAHDQAPFTRIIAAGELGILRAARLRAELGVAGQSVGSALAYRDKVTMKDLVARAGVRVPRYRAVDGPSDLLGFVRDVGFPVVLKPRSGAGSVNTQVLQNEADLHASLAGLRAQTGGLSLELIVEEFVHGRLYHVNGYATADGRVGLIWPASYLERGNLDAMNEGCVAGDFLLDPGDRRVPAMTGFAEACLRALPWPEHGFCFHLEVFETDDTHELVFCEVACRHGGGTINDIYSFGFGVSLLEVSLRLQAGLAVAEHATRPQVLTGGVSSPVRTGRLVLSSAEPPPFPWVLSYDLKLKSGDSATGPKTCVDASANFVVKGTSTTEVLDRLDQANRWFEGISSWDNAGA